MSDAQTTATTAPAAGQDGAADEVLLEVRDGLGRITLNRPRALNALTQDMVRAIDAALTDWAADPAVRGVLIRG
ncbi:MAG TPA: enoyl-CoA hydratase/isomerase family protein, partial [Micrococcus luteus]|nr:enoyl-CoA hydratase/isomerase family protein [Micrococcus luteus]